MKHLTLELQKFNQVAIVTVNGRLDAFSSRQLRHAVESQLQGGLNRTVLHCANVEFGSIAGVRTILQLQQQARQSGGDLLLVAPSRPLCQVLALTEADRLIKRYATLNEAISSLFIGAFS